jgi:hypothetical protein
MKKTLLFAFLIILVLTIIVITNNYQSPVQNIVKIERKVIIPSQKGKKKTMEERALYNEARDLYEYYRQVNPITGVISKTEKSLEFQQATNSLLKNNNSFAKAPQTTYINRGPSNMGGRTRSIVVDRNDVTGNTLIAGGVSGGVFRTTNGGTSWAKVSANDEIHSVTTIVQDPRAGFEGTWYYGTGEGSGNSASLSGSTFYGQGIWKSTNGGTIWSQVPSTNSAQELFDNRFDFIHKLAVHPTTGDLYAAIAGRVSRFNGADWFTEVTNPGTSVSPSFYTDVVISSSGRVYAAFSGNQDASIEGVWTSATGNSTTSPWSRINANRFNTDFTPAGRVVLALAPSNENKLYTLFVNGNNSDCATNELIEADLWMWDQSLSTYTNYSNKLPNEVGCSDGNDPLNVQGGYDLVVSVKPDDENFVVIGGTNAYKMANISVLGAFARIGGYASAAGYSQYTNHHPDIHALVFNPFNNNVLFSGTDGGVHKTSNITASTVAWTSLNNNYQTTQFYHVAIDPQSGGNYVLGGLQDNGTNAGGTDYGMPDLTTQAPVGTGDGGASAISRDDACLPFFISVQGGVVYRDCPNGKEITPTGSSSDFFTYFYLDPDNNNALYYAGQNTLYRTTTSSSVGPDTWTNMSSLSTTESFQTFSTTRGTYSAASSYLLMGGDEGHVYRLNDPQNAIDISSAVDITPTTATLGFPSIVTGLAIHPTNHDIILATYSNYGIENIFLTTNATAATPTWTLVERNLLAHSIRSAAIAEVFGQTIYFVGTARGLYSTTDPTTTDWVREAPTQIGFALVSSLAYRPSDNHLLIGTHGNGMYESTITNTLGINKVNDISNNLILFPNPVESEINIKLLSGFGNIKAYSIKNISGQSVMNGKLLNNKIDVSYLRAGIYFIQINVDGKTGTKKFIKN